MLKSGRYALKQLENNQQVKKTNPDLGGGFYSTVWTPSKSTRPLCTVPLTQVITTIFCFWGTSPSPHQPTMDVIYEPSLTCCRGINETAVNGLHNCALSDG